MNCIVKLNAKGVVERVYWLGADAVDERESENEKKRSECDW